MVKCENCEWVGQESELKYTIRFLDDDAYGAGPSQYAVLLCPDCGYDELIDGEGCPECGEFVAFGIECESCGANTETS